jgi:cytoskeletal protein CcmA (bactofilin family)
MEKKSKESIEEEEKRASISSTGDYMEFDEHVSVSGSAKISGGKLNKSLRLSGSGGINGDLECNELTSSGTLKGSGNLTVHGDVSSSGSFNIAGFLYGDGSMDFSGSAQIGNLIRVQGALVASGSFKAGHFVTVDEGIELSGSSDINGNLSAQKTLKIDGTTKIEGNAVAENILFGTSEATKKKQHYRIHGSVLAKNTVDVNRTLVGGDIKGKNVTIGRGSEIYGNVYYVDKIEVDKKAKLANEPVQITFEEL